MTDKEMMTLAEFTREYSLSRSKAYKEAAAGRLKLTKLGKKVMVIRKDADDWMNALPKANIKPTGEVL